MISLFFLQTKPINNYVNLDNIRLPSFISPTHNIMDALS